MNKQITARFCAVCVVAALLLCACRDDSALTENGIYVIAHESVAYEAVIPTDTGATDETVTEPETEAAETLLKILRVSSPVAPNETASLSAAGYPGTRYAIAVYYASGKSEAKGLSDKTADGNGVVTWKWKIGQRTKPGTYRITVSGGGETVETTFTVTEAD